MTDKTWDDVEAAQDDTGVFSSFAYTSLQPGHKRQLVEERILQLEGQHYSLVINKAELSADEKSDGSEVENIDVQLKFIENRIETLRVLLPKTEEESE